MELDPTDRKILHLLQEKTRTNLTHEEIADRIGVSSSTVSNRLKDLKESGILVDYRPEINYERAGIPHHLLFVCTAPISERKALVENAIDVENVINVRELLTGRRNIHVEIVCLSTSDVEDVAKRLDSIGLEIERSEILRYEYSHPFNGFDSEMADESTPSAE